MRRRWVTGEYNEDLAPLAAWMCDGPGTDAGGPDRVPNLDFGHDVAVRPLFAASTAIFCGIAAISVDARAGQHGGRRRRTSGCSGRPRGPTRAGTGWPLTRITQHQAASRRHELVPSACCFSFLAAACSYSPGTFHFYWGLIPGLSKRAGCRQDALANARLVRRIPRGSGRLARILGFS